MEFMGIFEQIRRLTNIGEGDILVNRFNNFVTNQIKTEMRF